MEKKNYKVTFSKFHYIADGELPKDFQSCVIITDDGRASFAVWDESLSAIFEDSACKYGSFFDGIGGHCAIEHVIAWADIRDAELES